MKKVIIAFAALVFMTQIAIAHAEAVTSSTAAVTQAVTKVVSLTPVQKAPSTKEVRTDSHASESAQTRTNRCSQLGEFTTAKASESATLSEQIATIQDKLQGIVTTFQSANQDTSKLQSAITSFQTAAAVCITNQQSFLDSINAAKEKMCTEGMTTGDSLKVALSRQTQRQQACRQMRDVFVQEVKPAVSELKDAYQKSNQTTSTTSTTQATP